MAKNNQETIILRPIFFLLTAFCLHIFILSPPLDNNIIFRILISIMHFVCENMRCKAAQGSLSLSKIVIGVPKNSCSRCIVAQVIDCHCDCDIETDVQ